MSSATSGPVEFRYFPSPKIFAKWTEARCACGAPGPNLDGAYFEGGDVRAAVCLRCLKEGKGPARDLEAARARLRDALKRKNPTWSAAKLDRIADERTEELAKSPPVPWLEGVEWPVCCGDFVPYRGEWARKDWERVAKDGNGQAALERAIKDPGLAAEVWSYLPREAGERARAAAFVFRCPTCKSMSVVVQKR